MAEQQLVDYIKKAREAGQADDQTRNLLFKNGWTEAEVKDAFESLSQPQPQPQSQAAALKVEIQPQATMQTKPQSQPQSQPKPQMATPQMDMPRMRTGAPRLTKLLISLIVLIVIVGVGYFVATQYFNLPGIQNVSAPNPQTIINNMLANTKSADFTFAINLTPKGTTSSSASANVRAVAVGGALYLQANNITVPDTFSFPGLDIAQIEGKWFKVDQDSLAALAPKFGVQVIANAPQSLQDLLPASALSVDKQLADQVIAGQSTYHYSVTISGAKMKDLVAKLIAPNAQINSFIDSMGDTSMEIWIGKNDSMLYAANLDKLIDLSKIIPGSNSQLEAKLDTANSNFSKPLLIQAPANSQKIEDTAMPLLKNAAVMGNMSMLTNDATLIFGSNQSFSSLCNHGLLNGYQSQIGQGLIDLNNAIVSGGATKPTCFSGVQSFCISTKLPDGSYYCRGTNNAEGSIACTSAQTVCK